MKKHEQKHDFIRVGRVFAIPGANTQIEVVALSYNLATHTVWVSFTYGGDRHSRTLSFFIDMLDVLGFVPPLKK